MIDLGTLGGAWGGAGALNNRGQVIGNSSLAADPGACLGIGNTANCHPFFWDDGKLIDLTTDTIGGSPVTAQAINDAGEVVGAATFSTNRPFDAYLWRHGVATDLGTLPGDCFSEAFAINAEGQVVGQSIACDFSTRSFLWENGSMFDLNTLIPRNSDLQLDNTFAISDRGEIAGFGLPSGCSLDTQCGHAFVLIPCDSNHADLDVCEDDSEGVIPATQSNLEPVNQTPTNLDQGRLTPAMLAAFRARFARHDRGLGNWKRR
jgi:probable HAF family extracellular repeat protein